jgi:D-alanyl-D-alanine carboxypeptidase/D-alanyl-D-alanine-endopeptidase (penicillin-binding protein 4)
MKRAGAALAFLLGLGLCLPGLPALPAASPAELTRRIDELLGKPWLKNVEFSVCITKAVTGEIVYEKNPGLPLLPASNMKVVTSAAALEYLGPEFAFVTRVGLSGDAVVVLGGGDPLFGDRDTDRRNGRRGRPVIPEIASRIKDMGLTTVSDIILDATVFDEERVHPAWPSNQLHQKYACEVSGLNFNGNCVAITAVNRDGRVTVSQDPPNDYVKLINAMTPGPRRISRFMVDRTGVPCQLLVQGVCGAQAGPYSVAVENPALLFGHLLRDGLNKAGVRVTGQVQEVSLAPGAEFRPAAEYRTPLGDCLQRMNKDSLGLAAEALFKMLGARSHPDGKRGGWEDGRKVIASYLKGLGLDDGDFAVSDGSGLSRDNRLSARALTRVLSHLASGPTWEYFKSTLAVGGLDGTMKRHFWEKKYRGRVLAKSGYIMAVRALSGVIRTDSGDYLFSFLANKGGNGARLTIDAAVKAVVDWAERPAFAR